MRLSNWLRYTVGTAFWGILFVSGTDKTSDADATPPAPPPGSTSASFRSLQQSTSAEKPKVMAAAHNLLQERYDLVNRPAPGVTMSRGKQVQAGVRVRLSNGLSWERLAALPAAEIRTRDLWPKGFLPLPHPKHGEGGMVFPRVQIEELKRQTGRDLTRFDLDFDLPDHVLPDFPPAIYLTTHPELGDVSQGKVVTLDNFRQLFSEILNPKQLDGLRLLLTPFPQQQFNSTEDRRSARPSDGVACLDCHVNGHSNGATHLVGDIRPHPLRHRLDTPSLRGLFIQRLFGSQRALKTVEDFTEFEQRAAYFDGDPVAATRKGINVLERGSQVHPMSELQAILDFPPAPKLGIDGLLQRDLATPQERNGQALFFGKAQCGTCHPAPYYTDNLMHNLRTERFYTPRTVAGHTMVGDGLIKTFPLRGIKDSPPYLHDGRLLTLEDTVEFFNLVASTRLSQEEKRDLVAFLRVL
jgi:cytochrome c peroxidase